MITSSFTPNTGLLSVFGDNLDNATTVSRDAAGKLLVNSGAVTINGGTPTVANTALIQVFAQGGNDVVTLIETNGALSRANLFGGNGNDVLTGGSGNDLLFGQADHDTLLGKGGQDHLFGGDGNDVLTGGDADDQLFGEAGNDRFVWNPGDDSDLVEGGSGVDTVEVNGGNGAESFTVAPSGTRVRIDRLDPAPFNIDAGTVENVVINANGGNDVVNGRNGLAPLVKLTVDGGTGNDIISGGDGADLLMGGDGDDAVAGGRGNDLALLGAGNDRFSWNPGDGSDTVEGQDGVDTLAFTGAQISENVALSANGQRVRFTRDIAAVTMDVNDTEVIRFNALGGSDTVTVGDLSGTDASQVVVDLAAMAGGSTGDAEADSVVINATNGDDAITLSVVDGRVVVGGLAVQIVIEHFDALDTIRINGLAGDDVIDAGRLTANAPRLVVMAGDGDDVVIGGAGNDTLDGGFGDDVLLGGPGTDILANGEVSVQLAPSFGLLV